MYSGSTGEVNSNRVTSSLLRKRTRLPTHAHEVGALTFEVTDNFGSNVVLPCGAYGPCPMSAPFLSHWYDSTPEKSRRKRDSNSHMHRKLKLASSPTCPWGQEEQTTEHVLQRCPLYKATREDVWPVSTSLTTKLYGCKTTSFISRAALIV